MPLITIIIAPIIDHKSGITIRKAISKIVAKIIRVYGYGATVLAGTNR